MDFAVRMLASGFFFSYIPVRLFNREMQAGPFCKRPGHTGAGFVGTVMGLGFFLMLPQAPGILLAVLGLSISVAVAVSGLAERSYGRKDDPRIVIDEIVGIWTAAAFLPRAIPVLASCFVLFRILDSFKPPFIAALEKLP